MQTKPVLTCEDVQTILSASQKEALANGWKVTIAVADDGGHLLGLIRLDGAPPMSAHIGPSKAKAAAMAKKETKILEDVINKGRTAFVTAPYVDGLLEGGVPIVVEGHVVGAVGVSGVQSDQDAQIAKAGIAAVLG
ncbi:MAG: heme-binding protein [Limnobacter sp.]|nr:heme-binding protein [Limnobacter sp.]